MELVLAEVTLRLSRGVDVVDLLLSTQNLGTALAAGLCLAVVVALSSRIYFDSFAREITEEFFRPFFANTTNRDVGLLSALPGLGEELLFRGALQPLIGIIPTSIVFGFLHTGFSRRLLPYSVWTTAVGFLLGALYIWTGNIWGSIVAHTLINASGVIWVRSTPAQDVTSEAEEE